MKLAAQAIYRYLDTNGDGTGTKNANGNYASVADEFYFQAKHACTIERMLIHIEDTTGMQQQDYGNIAGGLTNGYSLVAKDKAGVTIMDLMNGVVVKNNGAIGRTCYDVELKTWGAGNEALQARWRFSAAGQPIFLPQGHRLSITFNDDLTGLLEHYFMLQGYNV